MLHFGSWEKSMKSQRFFSQFDCDYEDFARSLLTVEKSLKSFSNLKFHQIYSRHVISSPISSSSRAQKTWDFTFIDVADSLISN